MCHVAACRLQFEFIPHGNFFNNLPGAPVEAKARVPPQVGAIAWNRDIIDHNKRLYQEKHPMVRARLIPRQRCRA